MKRIPVHGCQFCGVGRTDHGTSSGSYYAQYMDAPRHAYVAPDEATKAERRSQ